MPRALIFPLPWEAVVDFVVLGAAIYALLHWSRDARALRVTLGILLLEAAAVAAASVGLVISVWVLHGMAIVSAVLLIVLFQPELRYALNRLEVVATGQRHGVASVTGYEALAGALYSLAAARRGALVVVQRRDAVTELVNAGVPLGGQLSTEILEAIFRKVSPVHDGAAVIEGCRITRVAALLPLSERSDLPRYWGTRHRAAMGLSEQCDAVVLVVSEERGDVSLIANADFEIVATQEDLMRRLRDLVPSTAAASSRWPVFTRREIGLQLLSVAIAAVVWGAVFLQDTAAVAITVPVQFVDVDDGMHVASDGLPLVNVRLRGSAWRLRSFETDDLVMRVSVAGLGEGTHTLPLDVTGLPVPLGVRVENITPDRLSLQLVSREVGTRGRRRGIQSRPGACE